jgi:hypothetical protein
LAAEPTVLQREAQEAWSKGEFEDAERSYRILIERGGLDPDELRSAYVRLGASRAILGKKKEASAAFRAAAVLDPEFVVPSEAGDKAASLAKAAKADVAHLGTLTFSADVPREVEAGQRLVVNVALDLAHLPVVQRVVLTLRATAAPSAPGGASAPRSESSAGSSVGSSVGSAVSAPASLSTASTAATPTPSPIRVAERLGADGHAKLEFAVDRVFEGKAEVEVDALDKFDNRVSSVVRPLVVRPLRLVVAPPTPKKPGVSFWATPWPYVLGGVMLAAGGVSAYYFWLRPTDDVTFGPVGVGTR